MPEHTFCHVTGIMCTNLVHSDLDVAVVLDLLAAGRTTEHIVRGYAQSKLTPEAIAEAIRLAKEALVTTASVV